MFNNTFEMIIGTILLFIGAGCTIYLIVMVAQEEHLIKKSPVYKRGFEHGFIGHDQDILKMAYRHSVCDWKPTNEQKYSNGYIAGFMEYEKRKCDRWGVANTEGDLLKEL